VPGEALREPIAWPEVQWAPRCVLRGERSPTGSSKLRD
jgi:hypothetical protein